MNLTSKLRLHFGVQEEDDLPAKMVNSILPKYRIDNSGRVPLNAICKQNQIKLVKVNEAPFQGRFRCVRGEPEITIRKDSNEGRFRFTLAHEIAHWLIQSALPERQTTLFRGMTMNNAEYVEEEKLADEIAAELIMPRNNFLSVCEGSICAEDLPIFTQRFGVSRAALLRRYATIRGIFVYFMKIIPTVFGDDSSRSFIDECYLSSPSDRGKNLARRAKLATQIPFDDFGSHVAEGKTVEINFEGKCISLIGTKRDRPGGMIPRWEYLGTTVN